MDGWISNCCGADIKFGDICCECGEHCEPMEEEYTDLGATGHYDICMSDADPGL